MREFVIATRGSLLAMAQAEAICQMVLRTGAQARIQKVETKGDQDREHALREIGGDGLFVRAIERTLLAKEADIAVHCGKDLPYQIAEELCIAGVPKAADARDCLIWREGVEPDALRTIGTGSPRRVRQLETLLPQAKCLEIRGNINTRLEKLRSGQYDGIVLAKAGLDRLQPDLTGLQIRVFTPQEMLPAACQGILALQCRADDAETRALLEKLTDAGTKARFDAERALFCLLQADCTKPVGVHAFFAEGKVTLQAMLEGTRVQHAGSEAELTELISRTAEQVKRGAARQGSVTLVGAGCGAGLITRAGLDALAQAEVLVYDDLIDEALTREVPSFCRLEYVGKRYAAHSKKQEEINALLVSYARQGKHVVRLKGGDSFVFGRGGEEYLALEEAGISCRVIPGVSSCIAVPECAGIPVTHRGVSRSFTAITGHTADGTGENYEALAKLDGTLVFLMGKHAYPEITARLLQHGKAADTPAAVISNGCSQKESRIDGTLADIARLAAEAPTPAILVVGQTAAFHMKGEQASGHTSESPLRGVHVTVTGTLQFARKLEKRLKKDGADVTICPTIRIQPRPDAIPAAFDGYGWLVFTSANGVRLFFETLQARGQDARSLAGQKIACIGKGTADRLAQGGICADLVPAVYSADALGTALAEAVRPGEKVLILRASNGSELLPLRLKEANVAFTDVHIYDSIPCMDRSLLPGQGAESHASYLVFASAAGAASYLEQQSLSAGETVVCIGTYTAAALPGDVPCRVLISESSSADGIAEVIRNDVG